MVSPDVLHAGRMNSPSTEMKTPERPQERPDTDGQASGDCSIERDGSAHPGPAFNTVWTGPYSDLSLPGGVPYPHPHALQSMLEPLGLRFHYPRQSTQCQPTYSDYLLEPQSSQCQLCTGPVPGPPDCSYRSPVAAPWFTNAPILCSMMPGDFHAPVANICVPQVMDHQQFLEGLTDFTSQHTQPAVLLVNSCEPQSVSLTVNSPPSSLQRRADSPTPDSAHNTDVADEYLTTSFHTVDHSEVSEPLPLSSPGESVLEMGSQSPQYHQAASPQYECSGQTAVQQPQAPAVPRSVGILSESKTRKPCRCTRSQCLKLYCECFANRVMCSNCDCTNCHNNAEHELKRHKAIESCLGRNPDAFRCKIAAGGTGKVKGRHSKGCNCKRSACLKNYCECYEANIKCTSSCKCVGCKNYDNSSEMDKDESVQDNLPASVITPAVVEAACGCLLARAEEAERMAWSPSQAEHVVLEEFGHCLSRVIKAMFENTNHCV